MSETASIDKLYSWKKDPRIFVREQFGVTPDAWQDNVLEAFPHHERIALKASKGPGKTAVEAWLAWNFICTRPHPKIIATSITGDNLSDNLWAEMSKWQQRSPFLQAKFEWTKTAITSKEFPETWWMVARTWPKGASQEQQADTLAGRHADYIMFVIDESGSIPPGVLIAAEAALGSCKEGHILQGGNTTDPTGMLFEACVTNRRKWFIISVTGDPDDPMRSPRVSTQWAQDLIDRYGRDHPYVMVNVLGQFPPASFNTLLSLDDIRAAQARHYQEYDVAKHPRILGVDVALFGNDASVMFPRQGLVAFNPERFRNIEPHIGAGRVSAKWGEWDVDACFVDNTGGFGASWISHLKLMGRAPIGIHFSQSPNDEQFFNKRAEMYWLGAEWIKNGGQLPPPSVPGMAELAAAMTQTTYTQKKDRLILEPKELIADRIGYSPDDADAFCLSFSHPVAPRMSARAAGAPRHQTEWDYAAAMDAMTKPQGGAGRRHAYEHDPFA